MTAATQADYELIRTLRRNGIFKDLKGDLIPAENGTIVIPCADGDRLTDLLTNHWRTCNGKECHHTLALNGGPLLIPRGSPVNNGEGDFLLEHAYGGHRLKAVNTVALYGHWPCGAAITNNLPLHRALEYCVQAKDRVRMFFRQRALEPSVVLCFHVDYASNGQKRSYFFDRKAWDIWRKGRFFPEIAAA